MGLIRKSLAVGSVGLVHGSSKKQRVAAKQLKTSQQMLKLAQAEARAAEQARTQEAAYRYATDEQYRTFVDSQREAARIAAEAAAVRRAEARMRRASRLRSVAVVPALMMTIGVMAVLVWAPHLVVCAARRTPFRSSWLQPRLLAAWRRATHIA